VESEPQQSPAVLASRTFGEDDQQAFARLTGDYNPIHMDPVAARRTQAGDVVVHGVHGALWALDTLLAMGAVPDEIASLTVNFPRFVHLGKGVELRIVSRKDDEIVATLSLGSIVATSLTVGLGATRDLDDTILEVVSPPSPKTRPANWTRMEDVAQLQGWMGVGASVDGISAHFPHVAAKIGRERTAAIALLSTVVGMECPGLHSLFSSFSVRLADSPNAPNGVRFRVTYTDDRFRIVRLDLAGAGIRGEVRSFLRPLAVAQQDIGQIARSISPTEFAGSTALIIGGSRGLGALVAKVIAAGGGRAVITYAKGKADALELEAEIRRHAGTAACTAIHYDAALDPAPQLASIGSGISHLYYFATPTIGQQRDGPFMPAALETFIAFYVTRFYECCRHLASLSDRPLTAFYPSTVFADNPPPTMIEYAMAKIAGELLCSHLNQSNIGVRVIAHRLPRLSTDQTATIPPVAARDPLEAMLPIIREVQGAATPASESSTP
jgi:acyl dehydratase/NAD(P)-dependent dehydrogenase (short-subunit alcohol dehydrogenase family)